MQITAIKLNQRFHVLTTSMKIAIFWDVVLCSMVEFSGYFREAYSLLHQGVIALMIEAVNASQTSVNIYHTTRHNNRRPKCRKIL